MSQRGKLKPKAKEIDQNGGKSTHRRVHVRTLLMSCLEEKSIGNKLNHYSKGGSFFNG